jgi:hypothetical protein
MDTGTGELFKIFGLYHYAGGIVFSSSAVPTGNFRSQTGKMAAQRSAMDQYRYLDHFFRDIGINGYCRIF